MLGTLGLLTALALAMLLPHLPGRYDGLATSLSFVVRVATYASLLFVPVGLGWLLSPHRSPTWWKLSLLLTGLVVLIAALAAVAVNQLALGILIGATAFYFLLRARAWKASALGGNARRPNAIALRMVLVPTLLVALATAVLPRAADWSRDRVIRHSAPLIEELESNFQRHGQFPVSLQSLNHDVPTGVMGVERFHYEPNGDSYNVYFVRPSIALDAMEVVMYNPRNEHRFTSHELDILQYDGHELDLRRGDRRRTPLAQEHWVSILFD
jgi:hypothetical protein